MPMKRYQLALAFAFGTLALAPIAQAATNAPSNAAPAAQSSSGATSKSATGTTKHTMRMHHGNKMARRTSPAMASENSADSAYRAALRQCVTGPAAQRDTCLDQAIARYGHA